MNKKSQLMNTIRVRIETRLKALRENRPPRGMHAVAPPYDEVFEQGTRWLNGIDDKEFDRESRREPEEKEDGEPIDLIQLGGEYFPKEPIPMALEGCLEADFELDPDEMGF